MTYGQVILILFVVLYSCADDFNLNLNRDKTMILKT